MNMEYECSCGKKHRSRSTVWKHKKRAAEKNVSGNVQSNVQSNKIERSIEQNRTTVLKEINLQEEYKRMTETVNPKKEEEQKEPKYKCGACGGTFDEKHKRCPHCGVEF